MSEQVIICSPYATEYMHALHPPKLGLLESDVEIMRVKYLISTTEIKYDQDCVQDSPTNYVGWDYTSEGVARRLRQIVPLPTNMCL